MNKCSHLGSKESERCNSQKTCQIRKKYGGVLVCIHPKFFSVTEESGSFTEQKFEEIMDCLEFLRDSNFILLDYGIQEYIGERYPYNQQRWMSFYETYSNIVNRLLLKRPIFVSDEVVEMSEEDLYQVLLNYLEEKFFHREVYILSANPLDEEELVGAGGKKFLNLIPFSTDSNRCQYLRIFEQEKHDVTPLAHLTKQKDGKTFCPISNYIMTCGLERAVGSKNDDFLNGNLFGFIHDYSLLVQYMVTNAGLCKPHRKIEGLIGDLKEIYINEVKYHGYQISPQKNAGSIWSKYRHMNFPNLTLPGNQREFLHQQRQMYLDFYPGIDEESDQDVEKVSAELYS